MTAVAVATEVRYRIKDINAPWTTLRVSPDTNPVIVSGLVRTAVYEAQARNLGPRPGQASAWATAILTVSDTTRGGLGGTPPGVSANVGALWKTGTVAWTATDTSATLSYSSAILQFGDREINYSAASTTITGTAAEVRTVYLYYDDLQLAGGSRTLGVTADPLVATRGVGRLSIGAITVTFAATGGSSSGTGDTAGGGGGAGGGGYCVVVEAFVITPTGPKRAGEIKVGDHLLLVSGRWGRVSHSAPHETACVRVTAGGTLTCSRTAPLGTPDGRVLAPDALGVVLVTERGPLACTDVTDAGTRMVQHITCEDDFFWAGDDADFMLSHHNLKPV